MISIMNLDSPRILYKSTLKPKEGGHKRNVAGDFKTAEIVCLVEIFLKMEMGYFKMEGPSIEN